MSFSIAWSQSIHIKIKDNTNKSSENVNVQLIKNGKTIDFKKTNNAGQCIFELSEKGVFSLKFTSVFYKTKILEINTLDQSDFEIVLEPQVQEIQEVEIKSRPKIAKAKEDTISFNLKAVRDGTERTTEDLIKKLPGLDISDNGKVTYKGNTIGQVLVEGNEFFGKNHKIATQNLSADMISGIDLWQNFTTLSGNQSTALNLKLKEEYKGKITGNIEGNYGTKNSYLAHSNLFKLGKIGNLALIADANNIAKDPISFMDFYEMNSQENIENSSSSVDVEIPSFLNNDNKVKSKSNQFGALQYSKSKKSFSITAFSILNNASLEKLSTTKRTAFEGQPQNYNFNEQKAEKNKGYLGTTQIKIKKSFDDKSFLYYNFGYNPTQDNFNQQTERYSEASTFYDIRNTVKNNNLSNFLSWNKQMNNSKIILALSQLNENYSGRLNVLSNNNLFLTNNDFLSQRYDITSNKYSLDAYLKNKNKLVNFNFHSGLSYKKDASELLEFASQTNESKKIKIYHYINDLSFYKQFGKFDFSGSLSSHFLTINESEKHYFEKSFKIKYSPKSEASTEIGIEYNSRYTTPNIRLLQYSPVYTKELSSSQNGLLTPDLLSNIENYKFTWNRFNMEKGSLLFFIFIYEKIKPSITSDLKNFGTFSALQNTIGQSKDRYVSVLSSDNRLSKSLNLKSKFSGSIFKDSNFIAGNNNVTSIYNFELSQKLSTNFKNRPLQFDLGYTFTKGIFEQSFFNTNSKQDNLKISLGIRTNIKKN
ncbi:hypothetical protein CEY12_18190 [Chryseobacterium sp. T16E-39]|nr:hypothetical protein CEY12_18190 [Chryseobacterium sp. T16E-39]